MKKTAFIFLLLTNFLFGQKDNLIIEIEYNYSLKFNNVSNPYLIDSKLTFNSVESLYEMDHLKRFESKDIINIDEENVQFSIKSKENEFVYKNFEENTIFYSDRVSLKKMDIKSKLDTLMVWTLSSETKKVLDYNCQKAVTEYGGRYYIAYFTNEIPIHNAPWRFHGLPGVILEIESTDKVFAIKATTITINTENKNVSISNPFQGKNIITWDKFLSIYRIKYDDVLRNGMSKYGATQELAKKGIVEYIKE